MGLGSALKRKNDILFGVWLSLKIFLFFPFLSLSPPPFILSPPLMVSRYILLGEGNMSRLYACLTTWHSIQSLHWCSHSIQVVLKLSLTATSVFKSETVGAIVHISSTEVQQTCLWPHSKMWLILHRWNSRPPPRSRDHRVVVERQGRYPPTNERLPLNTAPAVSAENTPESLWTCCKDSGSVSYTRLTVLCSPPPPLN